MAIERSGRRVLIVEDDYLIADAMGASLELENWCVIGPFPSVATARKALVGQEAPDVAVLDVNLGNEYVFPLLDQLLRDGIPIVLTSGYDADAIPAVYANLPRLQKPVQCRSLVSCLESLTKKQEANSEN